MFWPAGAIVGKYHKHYFVPASKMDTSPVIASTRLTLRGQDRCVADLQGSRLPMVHPSVRREDVTLMLVPAWDWEGPNAVMHYQRMALVRGVENGFAMAQIGQDRIRHRARRIRSHPGVEFHVRRRPRDGSRRCAVRSRKHALLPAR